MIGLYGRGLLYGTPSIGPGHNAGPSSLVAGYPPKVAAVVADFNTALPAGVWIQPSEGAITNGQYVITKPTAGGAELKTVANYDLTGSAVYVQAVQVSAGSQELRLNGAAGAGGYLIQKLTNGNLRFEARNTGSYFDGGGVEILYDPAVHVWWRIEHDGTNVVFATSVDGVAWTARRTTAPTSQDLNVLQLALTSASGTAVYDNLNTPPDVSLARTVDDTAALTDTLTAVSAAQGIYSVLDATTGTDAADGAALTAANIPATSVTVNNGSSGGTGAAATFTSLPVATLGKLGYRFVAPSTGYAYFRKATPNTAKVFALRGYLRVAAATRTATKAVIGFRHASGYVWRLALDTNNQVCFMGASLTLVSSTGYNLPADTYVDFSIRVDQGAAAGQGTVTTIIRDLAGTVLSSTTATGLAFGTNPMSVIELGSTDQSTSTMDATWTYVQYEDARTTEIPPPTPSAVLADTVALADAVTVDRATAQESSPADLAQLTDTLTAARELAISDSAGLTDADGLGPYQSGYGSNYGTAAISVTRDTPTTDPLPATDTLTSVRAAAVALSDGIGATDTLTTDRTVTLTDPVAAADLLTTTTARDLALSDALPATDALSANQAGVQTATVNDTAQLTDAAAAVAVRDRTLADPAAISDALTADRTATLADPVAGTDAATIDRATTQADTGALTDALTVERAVTQSDTLPITDISVAAVARIGQITDVLPATDQVAVDATRTADLTDPVTLTDTLSSSRAGAVDASLADVTQGSDTLAVTASRVVSLTDSAGATDTLTAAATRTATTTDQVTATDTLTVDRAASLIDPLPATDAATGKADRAVALTDTATAVDALTAATTSAQGASLADPVQVTDAITVERSVSLTDGLTAADTPDLGAARVRTVSDLMPGTDLATADRASANGVTLTDPLAASDALAGAHSRTKAVADTADLADAVTADRAYGRESVVADPLTVLDQIEATWVRAAVLTDTLPAADATSLARALYVNDTLTVTDVLALFAGPTRDLELTHDLLPARYKAILTADRYSADLSGDRYAADVDGGRYAADVNRDRYEARVR